MNCAIWLVSWQRKANIHYWAAALTCSCNSFVVEETVESRTGKPFLTTARERKLSNWVLRTISAMKIMDVQLLHWNWLQLLHRKHRAKTNFFNMTPKEHVFKENIQTPYLPINSIRTNWTLITISIADLSSSHIAELKKVFIYVLDSCQ